MPARNELIAEIEHGPSGESVAAFFDLDRTLLAGFSAAEFIRADVLAGRMGMSELAQTLVAAARFQLGALGFSAFVASTVERLAGQLETEFAATAEEIFEQRLAAAVYPESRALVHAHLRKGHTVAVVSSATRYQIEPLARDLGIAHVLCTGLEVRDGRFTGQVVRPTCYGEGKATAARAFATGRGVDLGRSYFYTDSEEDLPLLEIVGQPRPTNASARLAEIAAKRGWPVRHFHSRGTPGPIEVLRTALAIGSIAPAFALGLPAALLSWNWRRAVNVAIVTWGEVGTALVGVDVHVRGEQHLWEHRPAVFIFNHQSGIDMLLLCRLLRRDIVAVAKQELRRNPIFGPAFALAGVVFVDRFDHERAVAALAPAVDTLRQGISLVLAPEGTRSVTARLGRFKKGAFRLAMTAGVPIVPIVFRNALDALPKHGVIVRPATVEVVVHPPIPTDDWTLANLDERIAAVHALYEETLDE
ncbi:MAG TPA: HAD-IB family hydrolase [Candidatus Binatia bacterium]|jgi:putative phosphoserine phosphatase/1-acylglycerol-3-phosphate O-acyltransferase